jgi:1-acyl-sn-glycerol-3-phosphate acyltransferase
VSIDRRYLIRRAERAAGKAERAMVKATRPLRAYGFPYRAPTVPRGVEVPVDELSLGADYDTDWARKPLARAARSVISEGPLRVTVTAITRPEVNGLDRLADLVRAAEDSEDVPSTVIFAPNHHSHLDTGLMIRSIPAVYRRRLVVAAAADYFFDKRWKASLAALALNAIPIDREGTGRRSADMVRRLVEEGWSLVIFPEGGRSRDGWGQEFKGGAAYLSGRTGTPVVPVYIDGTGSIFGKGMKRPKPGRTRVTFGAPLVAADGENTRRFNARIEAAVTALADESTTDYWTARRRAAEGTNPSLTGPEYNGWRRHWVLSERRQLGIAGLRRRQKRRWPKLD